MPVVIKIYTVIAHSVALTTDCTYVVFEAFVLHIADNVYDVGVTIVFIRMIHSMYDSTI